MKLLGSRTLKADFLEKQSKDGSVKAKHLVVNKSILNENITIDADYNCVLAGPITANSIITINGTLTIV